MNSSVVLNPLVLFPSNSSYVTQLESKPLYSIGERIFRAAVFQVGANKGLLERIIMWIYNLFSKLTCSSQVIDEKRAAKGLQSLKNLGATVEMVTPQDGKANLQMLRLNSDQLKNRIQQFGAKWEKLSAMEIVEKHSILAITPPNKITDEWRHFEQDLLKLMWKKRTINKNGKLVEVIVTCDNADMIGNSDLHSKLFLHINSSGVSFIMLPRRMGFYLGCMQNICFYDPRGSWKSTGNPSEGGYYNDAMAIYNKVKDEFSPKNIWVSSTCGGSAPAGYLKSKTHALGVNFIFENGFNDLKKDFVDRECWLVRKFADKYWSGLSAKDIEAKDKPLETGFNLSKQWEHLKFTQDGQVLIVSVVNDQRLSPEVAKHNVALAKSVNAHVHHLSFTGAKKDPHFDRYFKYPEFRAKALSYIFQHNQ